MAIIRAPHKANFIIMNKICLQDSRLSWKSKGIYAYVMSLPDNWKVKMSEITRHSTDGRTALMSGIKELIEFGYCTLIENRNPDGTMRDYDYIFNELSENSTIIDGYPLPENPITDNPIAENQVALLSIDISNIDSSEDKDKTIVLSGENEIINKKAVKKKSRGKKKTPRKFNPNSIGGKLARFMLDKIEKFDPSFTTPEMGTWEACFNKMILVDGYAKNEIKEVISFGLSDNFWKAVILNPYSLKRNYYKIKTRMLNPIKREQTREEKKNVFDEAKEEHRKLHPECYQK